MQWVSVRLILMGLAASALAGCDGGGLPSIDMDWTTMTAPSARVKSVHVVEQSEEGARLEVEVELINENDVALPLLVTDYALDVDGAGRFEFLDTVNRTVPARGKQTLRVAAAVPTGGRSLSGSTYRVSGLVRYMLPGELPRLAVESGVPPPSVDFVQEGRLE